MRQTKLKRSHRARAVVRAGLSACLVAACGGDQGAPAATASDSGLHDAGPIDAGHDAGRPTPDDEHDSGMDMDMDMDMPVDKPLCSRDGFCWDQPRPQGETLRAAWAASRTDVWLAGDHGSLLHYDGATFEAHALPERNALRAVHGSAADDVWAVGEKGRVYHYDGKTWQTEDLSKLISSTEVGSGGLFSIFAAGRDCVWAVGHTGVSALVLYYDGKTWTNPQTMALSDQPLRSVWAVSRSRAWAVGDKGVIMSFDGTAWKLDASATQAALRSVHALSETDVWVVGDGNTALRWDGMAWKLFNKGLSGAFHSVRVNRLPPPPMASGSAGAGGAAASSGTAAAGGSNASAAGSGGSGATPPMAPQGPWLVYAFGDKGRVYRYNGQVWAALPSGTNVTLLGAARLAEGALIAVGEHGQVTRFVDDGRQSMSNGAFKNHLALWSDGSAVWAVGDNIEKHTGETWSELPRPVERALYAVWGDSKALWAVGTGGSVVRRKDKASPFEQVTVSAAADAWLRSVFGADASLWIVGDGGMALTAAAGGFVKVTTPVRTALLDVWGMSDDKFWAVGEAGVVLRWDGTSWNRVPTSSGAVTTLDQQTLRTIWGTSATDIWVGGTESTLLHWDGTRFSSFTPDKGYTVNDIWGRSASDVYAVGSSGVVLHYDGKAWTQLDSGTSQSLQAVTGDAKHVYVAGMNGALLVRETP